MPRVKGCEAVYEVAEQWKDRCLEEDGSLLWPDLEEPTWTVENLEKARDITLALAQARETTGGHIVRAFSNEPDSVKRVIADATALWNICPGNMKPETRQAFVKYVSSLSRAEPDLQFVNLAIDQNIGSTEAAWFRPGFQLHRGRHLAYFLEAARQIKMNEIDPNDFASASMSLKRTESAMPGSMSGRNMLLHMLFPERIEPIFNDWAKEKIANSDAFSEFRSIEDWDERLEAIAISLTENGEQQEFSFYDSDIREKWRPVSQDIQVIHFVDDTPGFVEWKKKNPDGFILNTRRNFLANDLMLHGTGCWHLPNEDGSNATGPYTKVCSTEVDALVAWAKEEVGPDANVRICSTCKPVPDIKTQRYWKVAPGADGSKWEEFSSDGYVAIGFGSSVDLNQISSSDFDTFKSELASTFDPPKTAQEQAPAARQLWRFLSEMAVGDFVVAYSEKRVFGWGEITGDYYFVDGVDNRHRREVEWRSRTPILAESLSPELQKHLRQRVTILELTEDEFNEIHEPVSTSGSNLSEVADFALLSPTVVHAIEALLLGKKQLFFEGPPGSGKTFLADLFARYLTENPLQSDHNEQVEFVQFHQSYGYEDFVEGIRPVTDEDGRLQYRVVPGIFLRMCDRAAANPDKSFVLVIDEINRGNLSRIFGELMMALEYRDKKVKLPYSSGDDSTPTSYLQIPKNLYLIGTMNSTDRSLAMIDYALRRRFYFYPLRSVENGDAPVLRRWLEAQSFDLTTQVWILNWFKRINAAVTNRLNEDFQIGHSYFMNPEIDEPEVQDRIWRYAIRPLLQEYFHGDKHQLSELDNLGPV